MKVLEEVCICQYVAMDHDRQNYHLWSVKTIRMKRKIRQTYQITILMFWIFEFKIKQSCIVKTILFEFFSLNAIKSLVTDCSKDVINYNECGIHEITIKNFRYPSITYILYDLRFTSPLLL